MRGSAVLFAAAALGASTPALAASLAAHDQQAPLADPPNAAEPEPAAGLPLVSSQALEDSITADKLMARARHLFEIAKESEEEHARPTRVIGSKGTSVPPRPSPRNGV